MRNRHLLAFFLLIALSMTLSAQVALVAPSISVDQGQSFGVNITTAQFENIVSLQMSIRWDASVVRLDSVRNFGLPFLDPSDFNTLNPGILSMVWFDFNLQGASVADGSTLFTLYCTAIGSQGAKTEVFFDQTPIPIEIGKLDSNVNTIPVAYELTQGEVSILLGTGFSKPPLPHQMDDPFPNPFSTHFTLPLSLATAATVQYQVLDLQGQICASAKKHLPQGLHQMTIQPPPAAVPGVYMLIADIDGHCVSRKIIFAPHYP